MLRYIQGATYVTQATPCPLAESIAGQAAFYS